MIIIATREVGVEGRGVNLVIISLVFAVASFAMVASRVCSRLRAKYALGLDDYAIILSLVCSLPVLRIGIFILHGW